MKKALILLLLLPTALLSQGVRYKWVKQFVGDGFLNQSTAVTADKHGNVYTTGTFNYTADFDPGPGVYSLTRPYIGRDDDGMDDMFISKLDSNGNFIWAKQIAANQDYKGTFVASIALDVAGNIYTAGLFSGTVDFDPGPVTHQLTAPSTDAFILKMTPQGDFIWAQQLSADTSLSHCTSVKILPDPAGNFYITRNFSSTVDFDPGSNIYNLSTSYNLQQYSNNAFLAKYSDAGNLIWVKQLAGTGTDYFSRAAALSLDKAGNICATGSFHGTVDFDPGPATYNLTSSGQQNAFVLKLDGNGNFKWAKQLSGGITASSTGTSVNIDLSGNIFTTNNFSGTIDFDPGPGVYNLSSNSDKAGLVKLDSNGKFIWVKPIFGSGGFGTYSSQSTVDTAGDIYTVGYFLTNNSYNPPMYTFVIKQSPDGSVEWEKDCAPFPSTTERAMQVYGTCIFVNDYGDVYTSGGFFGKADFDPGPGIDSLDGGLGNVFIHKMSPCRSNLSFALQPIDQYVCPRTNAAFAVSAPGASNYQWQVSLDSGKTYADIKGTIASAYTINAADATLNGNYYRCVATDGCNNIYSSPAKLTLKTAVILKQPQNISVCPGNNASFTITANGADLSYQRQVSTNGGTTYTTITGATSSTCIVPSISDAQDSNLYRCLIIDECGAITYSSAAKLTIATILITLQPQNTVACPGSRTTFTIAASGNITHYQSQVSIDNGISYTDIFGAQGQVYTLSSVSESQAGNYYRCRVTNECKTIFSSAAQLSVTAFVNIDSHPVSAEVCSGSSACFSISARSTQSKALSYQWEVSTNGSNSYIPITTGGNFLGITSSLLVISTANLSLNNNSYRCQVLNTGCSPVSSNAALLIVHNLPSALLAGAPFTSLSPGQTTTLTATTAGSSGNLSSTW